MRCLESLSVFVLGLYNVLFFFKFYKNPHLNNTSEMGSTFYPYWHWMGEQLKKFKLPFTDSIYYRYPVAIPFLSTLYLPHLITSLIGSFRVLQYSILLHYFLGSTIAFFLFREWASDTVALFGAITLFYSGYSIKIQQPCIIYTMAWIPGIFFDGWFGILSMAMCFYGGYYPILIYLMPFILVMHTKTVLLGFLFALPQLIPFMVYYFKSVRSKTKIDKNIGKFPISKLVEFFLPVRNRTHTSNVMFMEMQTYMSALPFVFIWYSHSRFWVCLLFSIVIAIGLIKPWDRIPARALYLATLSVTILATDGLSKLGLSLNAQYAILFLQMFLLLFNRDIYPCFPFTQWWTKSHQDVTGYLGSNKIGLYNGAFKLNDA